MLHNDFYTIQSIQETGNLQYMAIVTLNEHHKIYEGHFPSKPVTPGVCTFQMVKECAQRITGHMLQTIDIASCKFTGMILPTSDRRIDIHLTLKPSDDNSCSCRAEVRTDKEIFMKLKCTFSIL